MMPICHYKRCRRGADQIFNLELWSNRRNSYQKYGEGLSLCSKHLQKMPGLLEIIDHAKAQPNKDKDTDNS
jgi:hypothetical protein